MIMMMNIFSPYDWERLQLGTSTTTIPDKRGDTIGCLKTHNNARSALRSFNPRGNVIAGRHPWAATRSDPEALHS